MESHCIDTIAEPRVAFVVLSYNQQDYIRDAIHAALCQDYGLLTIVFSDDCSTDNSLEIIRDEVSKYDGPHQVIIKARDPNMGVNAHVNAVMSEVGEEFIIIAAGDDISLPERTRKLVEAWKSGVQGVYSNATIIDSNGQHYNSIAHENYAGLTNWKDMVRLGSHGSWGCAYAWDRKVFDVFGGVPLNVIGEDAAIPFRCALLGKINYLKQPLVLYRDHGQNLSFWSRIKTCDKKQMMTLSIEHLWQLQIHYENWIDDVQVACEHEFITKEELDWAVVLLEDHIRLKKEQMKMMGVGIPGLLMHFVIIALKACVSRQPSYWVRHSLSIVLQYRFPNLRRALLKLRARGQHA
ncbi:Glycosyl transferase family 2 [Mariprofundus aestuarium]|uniref:Glycosyl transferase family 2 n=1 Tax=Mariprofundus aestuarium TaxID=1921086 RepID=A0A2K8KZR1_MARES|nr:glycosyltransferase [Mariprofundus aestuarium]ATX80282.1 Glycosyl transferase family 2 [Mariprofundus aestuarium]